MGKTRAEERLVEGLATISTRTLVVQLAEPGRAWVALCASPDWERLIARVADGRRGAFRRSKPVRIDDILTRYLPDGD